MELEAVFTEMNRVSILNMQEKAKQEERKKQEEQEKLKKEVMEKVSKNEQEIEERKGAIRERNWNEWADMVRVCHIIYELH